MPASEPSEQRYKFFIKTNSFFLGKKQFFCNPLTASRFHDKARLERLNRNEEDDLTQAILLPKKSNKINKKTVFILLLNGFL